MNVFESDIFSMIAMTAAINEREFVPARLGELGLFDSQGVATTQVWVERQGDNLALVASTPRGTPLPAVDLAKRKAVSFDTFRLAESTAVLAEEVQGIREFGTENMTRSVESARNEKLGLLQRRIEATKEWHRVGAVRGLLREPNGDTIVDIFDKFDLTQVTVDMDLETPTIDISEKSLEILEGQEDALGDFAFLGSRALCGRAFWHSLIEHPKLRDTYLNQAAASALRGDRRDGFDFGGIFWERYRGKVSGEFYIPEDEAYCIPEGVEGLFIERYAPADYAETVNTRGLPFYAKGEPMKFNRGIEIEAQSNPIMLCTRPRSVIKIFRTNAPS